MRGLAILPFLALYGQHPASTSAGLEPETGIVRVDCADSAGTAFRVGPNLYISVAHVTSGKGCTINSEPVKVTYTHGDFTSFVSGDSSDKWLAIDCGGFVPKHHYIAIGYARDLDTLTSVDLTATGLNQGGEAILLGVFVVIPGMSGGPIVDAGTGSVVGTVNAYNQEVGASFSTPLKGTRLCPS